MDINTKKRAALKLFFVKNAIPTESNFSDLIDAPINQKDDGLVKVAGDALNVEAAMTTKVAIRLYESFTDTNAAWTLGVQDNNSTSATVTTPAKGFTLADATGNTRLFVNGQNGTVTAAALTVSGAVNAGTLSASGTLTAMSSLTATGLITASGGLTVAQTRTLTADLVTANGLVTARAGLSVPIGQSLTVGNISLTNAAPSALNPNPGLAVSGPVTVQAGLTAGAFTATGLVSATMGLTVTGAPLTVGGAAPGAAQSLTVYGLTTANGGLAVAANQSLATDTLTSTTATGGVGTITVASGRTLMVNALTAGGTLTASQALNVTGLLTATGGVMVPGNQTLSVGGLVTATGGITIPIATSLSLGNMSLFASLLNSRDTTQVLTVQGGGLSVNGLINAGGLITASGGLTVATNQVLNAGVINAGGLVSATAGLTVGANQTLTAGVINASGLITANAGLALGANQSLSVGAVNASGLVAAGGGLIVPSGRALHLPGALSAISPARSGLRLAAAQSQHVILPNQIPASVRFDNGFTVQAWIYVSSFDQAARIIDFGNGVANDNIILCLQNDFSFSAQVYRGSASGTPVKTNPGTLSLNTWTHVAVTMDNTGLLRLYKNGLLIQTTVTSTANVPVAIARNTNYIGRSPWPTDPYFNGWLSEVSVWIGVRDVTLNPLLGTEPGLVGYWRLDGVFNTNQVGDTCSNPGRIGTGNVIGGVQISDPGNSRPQVTIVQEDWVIPDLSGTNSSSNGSSPVGFFKDSMGIVHLRGYIRSQQLLGSGFLFNLPPGYRPQFPGAFSVVSDPTTFARLSISQAGDVATSINGGIANNGVFLDGITFRAANP